MKYRLVTGAYAHELETEVNTLLSEGWVLHGSANVVEEGPPHNHGLTHTQAMTKNAISLDARYVKLIKDNCNTGDTEADHILADNYLTQALRELGLKKTCEAFDRLDKWYA